MSQAAPRPFFGYYTVDIFDCPPFEMFSNGDDPIASHILHLGKFEPYSMKLWCHLACMATGIVDIGAHVGLYTLVAAALRSDIPIFAFEPNPHAYARLRVNKMKNDFKNISESNFAVGEQAGLAEFSWLRREHAVISSGGHIGPPKVGDEHNFETSVTRITPLDAVAGARDLGAHGLIKIDVEGAEALVFAGMRKTVETCRPDIILETFQRVACEAINPLILPLGYKVFGIDEAGQLLEQPMLLKKSPGDNRFYNQLLTTRPERVRGITL